MNFVCIVFELGDLNVNIAVYGKPNSAMQPYGEQGEQPLK